MKNGVTTEVLERRLRTRARSLREVTARVESETLAAGDDVRFEQELADLVHYSEGLRAVREAEAIPSDVYQLDPSVSFFFDAVAAREGQVRGDSEARLRLKLQAEQLRSVSTSGFAGLLVPPYLLDLVASAAREARPLASLVTRELPSYGIQMVLPRVTTAAVPVVQGSENAAAASQDVVTTALTFNVSTALAAIDVTFQALDRAPFGVDAIIAQEVDAAISTLIDAQLIAAMLAQAGTTGYTFTSATPTGAVTLGAIGAAASATSVARKRRVPLAVMHSRRWFYATSRVDAATVAPIRHGALPGDYDGVVGAMAGVQILTDDNIATNLGGGTNEDRIFLCTPEDLILLEGPTAIEVAYANATTAGALTARLNVRRYFALTTGRFPAGIGIMSGTGLAAVAA